MAELVGRKPDMILAANVAATVAASKATSTIPIVMLAVFDPIGIIARQRRKTDARRSNGSTDVRADVRRDREVQHVDITRRNSLDAPGPQQIGRCPVAARTHHFLAARIGDEHDADWQAGVLPPMRSRYWMTGPELKRLRASLGSAIGRQLSPADMAKLCGLAAENTDTIRRWEVSGPSGPACELLRILAMASEEYPILENFNVFDRFDVREQDRPARRAEFREMMRNEVRRRLA